MSDALREKVEAVAGTESPLDSSRFDVAGFLATATEMTQGACIVTLYTYRDRPTGGP